MRNNIFLYNVGFMVIFMIPKIIHYCWFGGGEKSKLAKKCIASWNRFCPDYEIKEWNETNFDVYSNDYTKYCYENKKWAFLSDYIRLSVVYEYGGIYLDTDVEVLRTFDPLLDNHAFFGFETTEFINTGHGFGAVRNNPLISRMLEEYKTLEKKEDGSFPLNACPAINTKPLLEEGLIQNGKKQIVSGALILPILFFNPYDDPTGRLNITKDTFSIHWYNKSWISNKAKLRSRITRVFHRLFGVDCFSFLRKK